MMKRDLIKISWLMSLLLIVGNAWGQGADKMPTTLAYEAAKKTYQQASGYQARFGEGSACYRLKDFACAINAFAQAAWQAADEQQRGRAVFNLANSHFFLSDFEQASVLFQEAGKLGVAKDKVKLNQSFADSLAEAVRRQLADLKETERRADWRAQLKSLPKELSDRLAEGIYLSRPDNDQLTVHTLSGDQISKLISKGLGRLTAASGDAAINRRQWAKTSDNPPPGNTMSILNRVMPMELGMPYQISQPYRIKAHRPW